MSFDDQGREVCANNTGTPIPAERNKTQEEAAWAFGVLAAATFVLFAFVVPWAVAWWVGP